MSFYKFCHTLFPLIFKVWLRFEVIGEENIPKTGPVVLAANHLSLLDPPVLGAAASRPVHFMAKAELFKPAFFGWIIRKLGVFPVRRGGADRQAIKTGLSLLEDNRVVAVFPEGTRSKTGELGRAGGGAFLMAVRSGAAVVPAYIDGTDLKRHPGWPKVRVIFGSPLEYDREEAKTREGMENLGNRWREAVLDLKKAVVADECDRC